MSDLIADLKIISIYFNTKCVYVSKNSERDNYHVFIPSSFSNSLLIMKNEIQKLELKCDMSVYKKT